MNSLRLYQVYGICRSENLDKPLIFNLPWLLGKITKLDLSTSQVFNAFCR